MNPRLYQLGLYRLRLESASKLIIVFCLTFVICTVIFFYGFSEDSYPGGGGIKRGKDELKRKLSAGSPSLLLILILSSPDHHLERDAVRDTWLRDLSALNVTALFVIGTSGLDVDQLSHLESELVTNGDVLLLDGVKDGYRKLTKKLVEALKWVHDVVELKYSFMFKGDDDTFVRLRELCEELTKWRDSPSAGRRLYWGFFDGRARVKRSGPWAETDWFMCDRYLPHARGGGYVLSHDLTEYIVTNSQLLQQYSSEDISVGAWLGPLKVERVHDTRFDTEYLSRGCNNSYLVTHKQDVDEMLRKHDRLLRQGRLCDTETKERPSYVYNWKAPPSLCCIRNDSSVP